MLLADDARRERGEEVLARWALTEKEISGEMRLLSTLRWAWLRNASGYIFMTGKV